MPNEETALATVEPKPTNVPVPIVNGVMSPSDMEGLWRLAGIMASSGLMPKGVDRRESVFVAVQMGLEVGLSPMQAVQNIAVINGRPAIWGDALLGLVQASGLLEEFAEFSEGTWPNDDYRAVCVAKRKGRQTPIRCEFSKKDAGQAGLLGKAGPWAGYPKRMMQMRARGFVLRDGFADVLKGLKTAEEIQDYDVDMIRTPSGSYAPDFGPNSDTITLPRTEASGSPPPKKESGNGASASADPPGAAADSNGSPPAPNLQPPAGSTPPANGSDGAAQRVQGSTLPTRRRQNKFQVDPSKFNGQALMNTAGIQPESLLKIRELCRDTATRSAVETFMRERVGYEQLSFLREEEAQGIILRHTPTTEPGSENAPVDASVAEGQQPAAPENAQTDASESSGDAEEQTIHCPLDNQDHPVEEHCRGGKCGTRNEYGWCGVIGEEPTKEVF